MIIDGENFDIDFKFYNQSFKDFRYFIKFDYRDILFFKQEESEIYNMSMEKRTQINDKDTKKIFIDKVNDAIKTKTTEVLKNNFQ